MRIRIAGNWRVTGDRRELDYERGIVDDVRRGKVAMGILGVRVWDTLGVRSFEALLAPFLVDSLALEGRALRSPLAPSALAAVEREGVVGIALLPGRLRRPFGITRLLVTPGDYRGAKVAIRLGIVAEETFRALGARPAPEVPVDFTGFDGAEVDPLTITENGWDQGVRGLTANVAFWPKAQTVVMNRKAYAALTPEQRRILAEAGREAVAPELAQIAREQRLGISILCGDHGFRFVNATPAEAVALRKAVQPVYARIERDPLTRRWTYTYAELLHCCGKPIADAQAGPSLSEFRGGRIYALDAATGRLIGLRGTYTVAGDVVTFVFSHHYPGLVAGRAYVMRFTLFRDRLTWSHVPGRAGVDALTIAPWTRVG